MKICGIICEYNPFHNGHKYLIEAAKRLSGADAVVCVMSGNFVQRGQAAIAEKRLRAKHAVLGGADSVLELPTPFATANAELFAKGGVKILTALKGLTHIAFGVESATEEELWTAARLMNDEPAEVSVKIKELSAQGLSYAKARAEAWKEKLPNGLLSTPNNILAVEYARALLSIGANVRLLPVLRVGSGYLEEKLNGEFSSATAIRNALKQGNGAKNALPDFIDGNSFFDCESSLNTVKNYAVLNKPAPLIAQTADCTEGLENGLKKAVLAGVHDVAGALPSARYTRSRISRILLQNALNITKANVDEYLRNPLYLRLLCAKKEAREVLSALGNADFPLIARGRDAARLDGAAKKCYETDIFAERLYSLLTGNTPDDKEPFI